MTDITPKEASEILSHYTDLGYGIVIEGEDTSKIKQALSFASKTLTNGTPITEGDLIMFRTLMTEIANKGLPFEEVLLLIDNAQTVPLPNEQIAWEQGYEAGLAQGKQDRPKGGWIDKEHGRYKCSVCGHFPATQSGFPWLSSFCPECGADMRGGAE